MKLIYQLAPGTMAAGLAVLGMVSVAQAAPTTSAATIVSHAQTAPTLGGAAGGAEASDEQKSFRLITVKHVYVGGIAQLFKDTGVIVTEPFVSPAYAKGGGGGGQGGGFGGGGQGGFGGGQGGFGGGQGGFGGGQGGFGGGGFGGGGFGGGGFGGGQQGFGGGGFGGGQQGFGGGGRFGR